MTIMKVLGLPHFKKNYSHSIVLGGLLEISKTTLFIPLTELIISEDIKSKISYGILDQLAVIPSVLLTALTAIVFSYVLSSPITPTVLIGINTQNACQI